MCATAPTSKPTRPRCSSPPAPCIWRESSPSAPMRPMCPDAPTPGSSSSASCARSLSYAAMWSAATRPRRSAACCWVYTMKREDLQPVGRVGTGWDARLKRACSRKSSRRSQRRRCPTRPAPLTARALVGGSEAPEVHMGQAAVRRRNRIRPVDARPPDSSRLLHRSAQGQAGSKRSCVRLPSRLNAPRPSKRRRPRRRAVSR